MILNKLPQIDNKKGLISKIYYKQKEKYRKIDVSVFG